MINILVGILSPSEGSVSVFGLDTSTDRSKIAELTGICSQQDILYDALTAKEHLYYFGRMRGVSISQIEARIADLSRDLEMDQILNIQSLVLSGGQKRKLCIALAFIHDPQLVVLDEMYDINL